MKISIVVAALSSTSIASAETDRLLETLPESRASVASAEARSPGRDSATAEQSAELHPGGRLIAFADAVVRSGPTGALLTTGMFLRHTFEIDDSGKYEKSYLQGGVALGLSPASFEPQAHVEYMPASFLALRADLAATRYFGSNQGLLRFASADAAFGDDVLSGRSGDENTAWAIKGGFSVMPRAKLGPVLVRTKLSFTGYRYDDPGPYVYEPELDTLLSTSDFVFNSHSDFLFQLHEGPGAETLLLGPMVESMRTIDTELSRTRLGATGFYVPSQELGNLRRPRLYAMAGVNVADPNRRGEPFAMLGVGADIE